MLSVDCFSLDLEKQMRNNGNVLCDNIDNCCMSHALITRTVVVLTIWFPNFPKDPRLSFHGCFFHFHSIVNTGLKSENESCVMESVGLREENEVYINPLCH